MVGGAKPILADYLGTDSAVGDANGRATRAFTSHPFPVAGGGGIPRARIQVGLREILAHIDVSSRRVMEIVFEYPVTIGIDEAGNGVTGGYQLLRQAHR